MTFITNIYYSCRFSRLNLLNFKISYEYVPFQFLYTSKEDLLDKPDGIDDATQQKKKIIMYYTLLNFTGV